eukprot:Platyproteum_vivax@DN7440_c0_g4_i1.p1
MNMIELKRQIAVHKKVFEKKERNSHQPAGEKKMSAKPCVPYREISNQSGHYQSSTCTVMCIDGGRRMLVANIGDSGLILMRRGLHGNLIVVSRTTEQQHSFNCPFQLSNYPSAETIERMPNQTDGLKRLAQLLKAHKNNSNSDPPEGAEVYSFDIQEGDLVIMGTDGVLDNLFDWEICNLCSFFLSPSEAKRLCEHSTQVSFSPPADVATTVCQAATERSFSNTSVCPFAVHSRQNGQKWRGGKTDDITCVALWIECDETLNFFNT